MNLGHTLPGAVSLLLLASSAACTATVTTGGTCSVDTAVTGCSGNASGYSCTGGFTPEQSNGALSCSVGTAGAGGAVLYCCVHVAFTPNTCGPDATVTGCVSSAIPFSCTGSHRPEQTDGSLVCSASGAPGPGGATLYCCNTAGTAPPPTACAPDSNVACARADTTGYSCPDGLTPPAPLVCGGGVPEARGGLGYCCTAATNTPATCASDPNVACTTAGTMGYTCPSGLTPPAPLRCGAGVPESGGGVGYCCASDTVLPPTTCGPSGAIACANGFAGYSCSGQDTPWQANPSLLCEPSTTAARAYCCVSSANSCAQAPAIIDCPSPYYGVSCSGNDTATAASPLLLCASDPNGGLMDFCCSAR